MGHASLRRILVIQTAFLGDVILATSVIEKLNQHYPESMIDFLLRKGNEQVLANHPFLNEVLVFDKASGKYLNLLRLISKIRKKHYDLVINLQRYVSTGLITVLSGASITTGFNKNPLSRFFSIRVKHSFNGIHEVERNHELIKWMTDPDYLKPRIFPGVRNYEKVEVLKNVPYLCLAPASVWFTKQFPVEKWAQLADAIPGHLFVYLVGSPNDRDLGEKIRLSSRNDKIRNLSGELDVLDTAALMESAVLNIVNDSAPMHIASAMNAPVCAIYCSTIPGFGFGPLSDRSYIIEKEENLYCRPCGIHGRSTCPESHFRCAMDIDVSKITAKVIDEIRFTGKMS
ncbi:MAG TPA: glycosyltransferase family 9 protein [Cyclobacteriaceae bacterium]|nr:glycosyltransferase family 9 protein [Cyclobacteriaceae bacterium]